MKDFLIATPIMIVLGLIWWLPVIVASKRQGANYGTVFALTLLAPLTFGITWIVALVKSFASVQTVRVMHEVPAPAPDWTATMPRVPSHEKPRRWEV